MRTSIAMALALAATALGGCASAHELARPAGIARSGLINDPKTVSRLEKSLTDRDIARMLDVDVRAKLPTTVAVARLESRCRGYQPYLATVDAEELNAWRTCLAGVEHVRGVHPVSPLTHAQADRPTLHSLRVAAAKLNCELLLVYLQADSSVDNFNDAAALYWTFVGLWVVPGNVYEHRTVMQALLVDCRTGVVLGTATGDSHQKQVYAAAYEKIAKGKLSARAPAEALADLHKASRDLLTRTVRAAQARPPRRSG